MTLAGSRLAFEWMMFLVWHTYIEDTSSHISGRDFDDALDELPLSNAEAIVEEEPDFRLEAALEALNAEIMFLAQSGVDSYLPNPMTNHCPVDTSRARVVHIKVLALCDKSNLRIVCFEGYLLCVLQLRICPSTRILTT